VVAKNKGGVSCWGEEEGRRGGEEKEKKRRGEESSRRRTDSGNHKRSLIPCAHRSEREGMRTHCAVLQNLTRRSFLQTSGPPTTLPDRLSQMLIMPWVAFVSLCFLSAPLKLEGSGEDGDMEECGESRGCTPPYTEPNAAAQSASLLLFLGSDPLRPFNGGVFCCCCCCCCNCSNSLLPWLFSGSNELRSRLRAF
jgi:hypothetical protein